MTQLSAERLHLAYDSVPVVENMDVHIPEGKTTVLVGSNGCGKSTILRSLSRLLKPNRGYVYLDGKEIHKHPTKEVAKKLAVLPQGPQAPEGLTVKELCFHGRHPHKGMVSFRNNDQDRHMVDWALEATNMESMGDRPLESLSGGQRQRAWIAMALAQGTDLLLLDEPTTYLDLAHQLEVLELLRELNDHYGRTIVMVLHELNHAARYADHMICIEQGRVYAEGAPDAIFTERMVHDVFGLRSRIVADPVGGSPLCVPVSVCNCRHEGYACYEEETV